jgi:hypothetical protein
MREDKKEWITGNLLDAGDKLDNAKEAFYAGDFAKAIRELNALKEDADFIAAELEEEKKP